MNRLRAKLADGRPGLRPGHSFVTRFVVTTVLAAMIVPVSQSTALAAPNLTVTPITWGVVGLDSNNVNSGPNTFASGARVCNTGTSAATDVTATYVWTTSNTYINLFGQNPLTKASLAAGACTDFYFNIAITRNSAAYDTARRFRIDVTADSLGTVSTPTPRELYVEHLVSQNRNSVTSVTGPTTVVVGNTYTYVLTADTAPGGYPQLSSFLNLSNSVFQIVSVNTTYTAPAGATNNTIYGDACGWQPNPSLPNYRSCVGPNNYSGGDVGGTVVTTYQVKIVATGSNMQVYGLIYDESGSSYHYNNDYGSGGSGFSDIDAVEQVDLSLTKSDSPNTVNAGEDLAYTIDVANAGPSTAHNVTVTDPLPGGVSFVSADNGGSLGGGTVTWNLGDVTSGSTRSLQLVVHVNSNRTTNLSNTATASTSTTDTASGNNADTEATTITTSADLSITKSDSPDPVLVGGTLTYTLAVANGGPSDANAVQVSDTLPAGVSFVSATPSQGSCSQAAGVVSCSLGGVADGATPTVTIVVTAPASAGSLSNSASVSSSTSDPSSGNNSDTEGTTVSPSADLSITKTDSVDPITAGNDLTYTLVVANAGPSSATSVVATDPVPGGTSFVSADGGGSESGGTVTWNLGTIASGASVTRHVTVHVLPGRTAALSNTATVSSAVGDPSSANDADTEATGVATSGDLSLSKTDGSASVAAGGATTYTITLTNGGPSTVPAGAIVTDTIPAGTTGSESESDCAISVGVLVCTTAAALAPGASASWQVSVDVPISYAPASVSNTASISSSPVSDPAAANNSATDVDTVSRSADLSIAKSDSADPVLAGQDLTYTLVVANDGPSDATNVVATDAVPAGTSFVSADGGGSESGGIVTWSLGTIADSGSVTVHVTVHVNEARTANISNTAGVSSDVTDPDGTDDSDSEATAVNEDADLEVALADSPDPIAVGGGITYTATVTNHGVSDATGVVVTNTLPAGTVYVGATPSQGSCLQAAGIVTCSLGTIADGGTATVAITVTAAAPGTVTDSASVDATTPDTNAANDADSEDTQVTPASDLSITKSDSVDPVIAGQNLTYTLVVSNAGPSAATNVVVTDSVPAGTSFVSADAGGSESGGTVTWALGGLANGGSTTVHVTVHVDEARTANITNTASVDADQADPDPSDDADTEATVVDEDAELSITKSDSADPSLAGQDLTYTLTVTNDGPSDATNVVVTDAVPAGTSFVSADGGGIEAAGVVTWNLGAVDDGDIVTVHVTVHVDADRTTDLTNTANVGSDTPDTDGSDDAATEATTVDELADLRIAASDSVDPVVAGDDLTYTLVVTNDGPSDATNVVVTDAVPTGTSFVSADGGGAEAAGTVTWTLGTIASGGTVTLHVTVHVHPDRTAALSMTADVSSDVADPDASNDSATEPTAVAGSADLAITKSDGADPVIAGTDLTYTLVATNDGPSDATGVVVTDTVPAGTTFVSADGGGVEAAGTVTWNVGTLADGDAATIHVTVHVDPARTADISNTATVGSGVVDPDASDDTATETTSVQTRADLSITKSDSADPVVAGTDLTYTLVVTNDGPSDATGVVATDPLPAGTSFVSADNGGVEAAGTVTWALGGLANGDSITLHVTVHVDEARTAGLSNTAAVTADQVDQDPSDDSATETTAVDEQADLSISKSDSADPALAGDDLTYTLVVTNDGPSDATNVVVTDPLPAGTSLVSADNGGVEAGGTVTWNLGTVADGAGASLHVTVHVLEGRIADLSNTASVAGDDADPDATNDSATEATAVDAQADLSLSKSDDADPVVAGTDLTYTLVVANDGPSDAVNVVVTDPLPPGVGFVSATPTQGTCNETRGTVTCDLGDLADGASATVTIVVSAGTGGSLTNSATVSSDTADPDPSDDSDSEGTTVTASADLSITKSDDADPAVAGTDLTYTLVVTNDGPSDATNVVVSDPVPAGTTFVSADGGGAEATGTVTWNLGTLAEGTTATLHVTVHVDEARTGALSNTAGVASDVADPDGSNDSATEATAVIAQADLHVTKDAAASIQVGADLTYSIVVQNDGPSDATNVVVSDPLPAGVTYGLATSTQGTCAEATGTVTCDLGTMANGAAVTITLIVTPTVAGGLVNTASATSDVADPDPSDDTDGASTTVTAATTSADLEVAKSASADPVYVGDRFSYTIILTNHGPDAAQEVVVTDPLDSDVSLISTDHGGVEAAGVVTWNLGNVASGDVVAISLEVEVLSEHAGLRNTATVASTAPDADASNDADTATVDARDRSALSADLQVGKTVDVDQPARGDIVTYTVTVTNDGPADATNVRVQDDLPDGLEYRSSHATVGDYDAGSGVWQIGSLPNGAAAVLHMAVKVTATADDGSIRNVARVGGLNETDPDDTNDSDQRDITVVLGGNGGGHGTGDPGGTAFTGADVARALALLLGFLAAGFVLLVVARRRREPDEPDVSGDAA